MKLIWQARNTAGAPRDDGAPEGVGKGDDDTLDLFLTTLRAARDEIELKGGRLAFVYLPEYDRYAGPRLSSGASRRDDVLAGVRALGIPVINVDRRSGSLRSHSVSRFDFKAHYNSAGAKVTAEAIVRFLSLEPDKAASSPSARTPG